MSELPANRPILIFPAATASARAALTSSIPKALPRPSRAQQIARLSQRFQSMNNVFGAVQAGLEGLNPEQVIVFETIGSVSAFQNVVKKIRGMEWLGDFDADIPDPDSGFLADGGSPESLPGRLFVTVGNQTSFGEILRLWTLWQQSRNEKLPRGYGGLAEVFKYLQDVRPWGPKDRIQLTGVVLAWEQGLASNIPQIRFEVELWCRGAESDRRNSYERLQRVIAEAQGQCVKQYALPEIDYHGVIVELPATAVRIAVDSINVGDYTRLLRLTDVKYLTPLGQATLTPISEGFAEQINIHDRLPNGEPAAALLDGLPLTNHELIRDRILLDDPNDLAAHYQLGEHRHGTSMASLIIHGDLSSHEHSLDTPLYVRPIMQPGRPDLNGNRWETFPPDEIPIDLIHRAVRRMFEGDAEVPAVAPSVKVINLSIGDTTQTFDRLISPWARLLDWLSWKYQVLFIVSAGNHLEDITIPVPSAVITEMSNEDLRSHALRAAASQRLTRRLIAPAESVNALTVGALHAQAAPIETIGLLVDLLRGAELPSLINPVGSGFRKSVKPEILAPAGMQHYEPRILPASRERAEFSVPRARRQPGQLVAAPGGDSLPPSYCATACGTSNAAALVTREAIKLVERIKELRTEPGGSALSPEFTAVVVKTMLVHGASWNDIQTLIESVFEGTDSGPERHWRIKNTCAQFVGYGPINMERGTICSDQRAIVLGCSKLPFDKAHLYKVPLPPALSAQRIGRKLTVTLTWLTPINCRHRGYCGADLWFDIPDTFLQVKRTDANEKMAKRGTVQHEVYFGDAAVPINGGDAISIQVNCRSDGGYRGNELIPYSIMASLEVAQPLTTSIYEQIRMAITQLRAPVAVRANTV